MGFDVNEIRARCRRVLDFSCRSCLGLVKKYPLISGFFLFFSFLYVSLPSVFSFLIFFLPLTVFLVAAFRLIFSIHQKNLQNAKGMKKTEEISSEKPTSVEDDSAAVRRKQILRRPQSVRRRNPKETISVQERVEEKDMVSSTVRTDDLVDKTALLDENPKEIREVKLNPGTNGDSEGLKPKSDGESKGRTDRLNGALEAESSDDGGDEDEEETQEDRNKAVEWTEDDQKNLMDLGDSEMERNKRLESLIARRRARKLMSMQPRRTPMVASLMIPKNNPFLPNSSDDPLMSPTPGSAPSVLLPFHNPFDIPYDPHEEKPNLTGGSFQDEFMEPPQKDMVFCRHESFSLGALFPGPGEFDKSRRDTLSHQSISAMKRIPEMPNYSLVKNETGEEDKSKLIQTGFRPEGDGMLHINSSPDHAGQEGRGQVSVEEFHQEEAKNEVHREARNEVREEPNLVQDVAGGSSSSSSSELNAPFSTVNKDKILKSLRVPCPKNVPIDRENTGQRNEPFCDINPYSIERRRPEEHFLYVNNMVSHTPRHSIASDLQVELSEVGSPALTIDETISPSEGASPMYDEDVEKNTFGSEEKWVASPNLSKVEENESRSTEVPEITEQDIIDVGFARMNLKPEDAIESSTLPGKVVQIDSVDEVLPHSKAGLPENSETHSIDSRSEVRDEIKPAPEKSESSSPSHYSNSQNLQDSSAQEVNVIYDRNNPDGIANDDKEILEFMKTTCGQAPISINFEGSGLSVPAMENSASSTKITQIGSENPENAHVESTKYSGGEFQKENDHNDIAEKSNLMGNVNVQDIEGEKGDEKIGSSGGNQNSDDPIASTVQLETVAEQGRMHSISPSSPKSMAEGNALTGQVSLGLPQTESRDQQFDEDKESHISPEKSTLVDAGFSGISQNDNNPIPSAVQPDLVTERVSIASCSSSSPKPRAEIMLPVDHPISSSYIDPEIDVKVQKSDEDVVYDKSSDELLPEHLTPAGPRNVLNMSSYLTARLSGHKDPAELKDPPNTPMMFTKQQNSTYSVKTLKTIDETDSEAHLLIKEENAGALPKLSEQSISQCIGSECMEGQPDEKMVEYKTKKSENLKDAEDSAYLNPVEYKNVAEIPKRVDKIDVLVSVQDKEVGISEDSSSTSEVITAQTGLHVLNQNSTSNPSSSADMPELAVEQVHTSSSSSSPNSVLQTKFSISSMASPDQQVPMGFQQPETEIDDNNKSSGALPENLTSAEHQNPAQLEDLTAHQSTTADPVNLQEPSNPLEKSIKEDNINCHVNSSVNDKKEGKLNFISRENGEGEPKVKVKHETDADPVEHSDVSSIAGPGGEFEKLTGNKVVTGMSKPVEVNENSELRESMKSTDVTDLSVPTNSKDTAEANAVEEGKSKTSVDHEANDVGPLQPGQQSVFSDIPVTSKERQEEPLKADQGESSENVSVVDVTDGKEEFRADAGDAEGETHKSMRTVAIAELSGVTEKPDPSSTEAMVSPIQPAEKNDNLIEKEDMEGTTTTLTNLETGLDPPTSVRSMMAPIM